MLKTVDDVSTDSVHPLRIIRSQYSRILSDSQSRSSHLEFPSIQIFLSAIQEFPMELDSVLKGFGPLWNERANLIKGSSLRRRVEETVLARSLEERRRPHCEKDNTFSLFHCLLWEGGVSRRTFAFKGLPRRVGVSEPTPTLSPSRPGHLQRY